MPLLDACVDDFMTMIIGDYNTVAVPQYYLYCCSNCFLWIMWYICYFLPWQFKQIGSVCNKQIFLIIYICFWFPFVKVDTFAVSKTIAKCQQWRYCNRYRPDTLLQHLNFELKIPVNKYTKIIIHNTMKTSRVLITK